MADGIFFWVVMLSQEGATFLGALIGATLLGIVVGLAIGGLVYMLYRLLRLLSPPTHRAWRIGTLTWLLISMALIFGFLGFHKGVVHGIRKLVTEGRIATEVVPEVGGGISTFIFAVDEELETFLALETDEELKAYAEALSDREGLLENSTRETLNVTDFLSRKDQSTKLFFDTAVPVLADAAKARAPVLADGIGEKMFDWFVDKFGYNVLLGTINSNLKKKGLAGPVSGWVKGLPEAAAEVGGDDLISRDELSTYTVESVLKTYLLKPVEIGEKLQRVLGWGVALIAGLLPLPILWYLRKWRSKKQDALAMGEA